MSGPVGAVVVAVCGAICASGAAAEDATAQYFEQLRRRGMHSVAEGYCLQQIGRENVSAARRGRFVVELSRTLADHARYTAGAEQEDLWRRARSVIDEFLEGDPRNPNRSWLEAQRGMAAASRGEVLRWEAELYPEQPDRRQQADEALQEAVKLLKKTEAQIDEELRNPPRRPEEDPDVIDPYAKRMLLYEVRLRLGRAFLDRARLFEEASGQREQFCREAENWLEPLSKGAEEQPTTRQAEIQLAGTARLRGDFEQAEGLLAALERKGLSAELRDRVVAEKVRVLLAGGRAADAGELLSEYRQKRIFLSGELRFEKTRMFSALWEVARENERPQLAADVLEALKNHVRRTGQEIGGYWSYRCGVIAERAQQAARYGPELAAAVRRAEGLLQSGKRREAAKAYAEAVRLAGESGKREAAAELAYTLGSVNLQNGDFASAAANFRSAAEQSAEKKRRGEADLMQAYCLGRLYGEQPTQQCREAYAKALQNHREQFAGETTAAEAAWMLARLEESGGDYRAALETYLAIPGEHPRAADAQAGAARCYELVIGQARREGSPVTEQQAEAIAGLERFIGGYPAPPAQWSLQQSEVAVRLARIFLTRTSPGYREADDLLEQVFASAPEKEAGAEPEGTDQWEALLHSAAQLRIVSLAGRAQIGEADRYLRDLTETRPREMLSILDGLTQIASGAAPATQRQLGELQLRAADFLKQNRGALSAADLRRVDHCLAQAYVATNQPSRAAETYEGLLKRAPQDRALLQVTAELLSQFSDKARLQRAKGYWRRLEALHKPGSVQWLQARYEVAAACFRLEEYEECRKLVGVTGLLYPELGNAELKEKFQKLRESVDGRGGRG